MIIQSSWDFFLYSGLCLMNCVAPYSVLLDVCIPSSLWALQPPSPLLGGRKMWATQTKKHTSNSFDAFASHQPSSTKRDKYKLAESLCSLCFLPLPWLRRRRKRKKSVTFLSGIAGYRFRQSRKSLRDFSEKGLRDMFAVLWEGQVV